MPKILGTYYNLSLLLDYITEQSGQRMGLGERNSAPLCHLDIWELRLCPSWSTCGLQNCHKIRSNNTEAPAREFIVRYEVALVV